MSGLKDRGKQEAKENLAIGDNLLSLIEKAKKIGEAKDKALTEDIETVVAWGKGLGKGLDNRLKSAVRKLAGKERTVESRPATDIEMKILKALEEEGLEDDY